MLYGGIAGEREFVQDGDANFLYGITLVKIRREKKKVLKRMDYFQRTASPSERQCAILRQKGSVTTGKKKCAEQKV